MMCDKINASVTDSFGGLNLGYSYFDLPECFYRRLGTNRFPKLSLVLFNDELAEELGLEKEAFTSRRGVNILAGCEKISGETPFAQAYAGHQFGSFVVLGDGRAMILGEHQIPNKHVVDLQIKGSGPTCYSRGGDGKAVLGPMFREFIISEAMAELKIKTTRSLAVITTGEDIFRNGYKKGAVLTRVAESHLRIGTFQFAAMHGNTENLRRLADYAIERHYPALQSIEKSKMRYLAFFEKVVEAQASLIAHWQSVGFIHGVMNTDNMTISGETIDYGPCAFMNTYRPETVFSSIDHGGRYAYENQPKIAMWNLARFAETLINIIDDNEQQAIYLLTERLEKFPKLFGEYWNKLYVHKIGFAQPHAEILRLLSDLLTLMNQEKMDYTNTFRRLTHWAFREGELDVPFMEITPFQSWIEQWQATMSALGITVAEAGTRMKSVNPCVIPRNEWVDKAIREAERGNIEPTLYLLKVLKKPYEYSKLQLTEADRPIYDGPYQTFCGT